MTYVASICAPESTFLTTITQIRKKTSVSSFYAQSNLVLDGGGGSLDNHVMAWNPKVRKQKMEAKKVRQSMCAAKVHKQHNSLVIVIPKNIAEYLAIKAGDTLGLEFWEDETFATMKVILKGVNYGIRSRRGKAVSV